MQPVRLAPPAVLPVTVDEAKLHLRVDVDDDDALIERLLATATQLLDGYGGLLGKAIISQEWEEDVSGWTAGGLPLCVRPVQSVGSLSVVDEDDATVEDIDLGLYRADVARGLLTPKADTSIPGLSTGQRLLVRYTAGYGAGPESVPEPIRQAILLLVGAWYENREQTVIGVNATALPISVGLHGLLAQIRGLPL